ncbi:hypothetical protein KIL84_000414 [Mauremys mutica]|uniref:Uncharacterized protein n=1 Tax=Mauremys mutica TaxID=74926 RepID=A0A9D4B2F9_9SAUR|nr:hypothetical protein KIL84_000414 [Mauremys mutica]
MHLAGAEQHALQKGVCPIQDKTTSGSVSVLDGKETPQRLDRTAQFNTRGEAHLSPMPGNTRNPQIKSLLEIRRLLPASPFLEIAGAKSPSYALGTWAKVTELV